MSEFQTQTSRRFRNFPLYGNKVFVIMKKKVLRQVIQWVVFINVILFEPTGLQI